MSGDETNGIGAPCVLTKVQAQALNIYFSSVRDMRGNLVYPGMTVSNLQMQFGTPEAPMVELGYAPPNLGAAQPWGKGTVPHLWRSAGGVILVLGYRNPKIDMYNTIESRPGVVKQRPLNFCTSVCAQTSPTTRNRSSASSPAAASSSCTTGSVMRRSLPTSRVVPRGPRGAARWLWRSAEECAPVSGAGHGALQRRPRAGPLRYLGRARQPGRARQGISVLRHLVAGHLETHRIGLLGENVHSSGRSIHQSENSGDQSPHVIARSARRGARKRNP